MCLLTQYPAKYGSKSSYTEHPNCEPNFKKINKNFVRFLVRAEQKLIILYLLHSSDGKEGKRLFLCSLCECYKFIKN